MFQMALVIPKDNDCAKLFLDSCINVQVMARTNPDGRTNTACTCIELSGNNYISLTASGLDEKKYKSSQTSGQASIVQLIYIFTVFQRAGYGI